MEKESRILVNKARCKLCGDIVISCYRHDFRSCKCGAIFVDGGRAYIRRGTLRKDAGLDIIEELSEFEPSTSQLDTK